MRRLLPYPLLWLGLVAMWVLLTGSAATGDLLLAVIVATIACLAVSSLEPPRPRLRRLGTMIQLVLVFVGDVVRSNIAVIRLTLSGREARSAFLAIPLDLREPNGLAILACIITATPGSAWIEYHSVQSTVLIHVLDVNDEAGWIANLKRNYESRLLEIFG
jgi:multicomponent K+:H+ antiporter subunit E